MKKGLLALGVMIACTSVVSAQPQQQPRAWAEKLFGPPANLVHNFGTVPRGTQLRHDFVLTNIYAVPISIENVRCCMGCLTAYSDKHTLLPGEKATITVWMDARRFVGHKVSTLYVTVGPHHISTAALTMTAISRTDLACNPGEVAFGSVAPGQTPSATVDVERAGKSGWQISEMVVPKDAPFEATLKRLDSGGKVIGYQVKVTLKKDAPKGRFLERIGLKTNDPTDVLLSVVVRGNIQEPIEAVPAALHLKEVKGGETLKRRVFVRSPKPFKIVTVATDAVTPSAAPPAVLPGDVSAVQPPTVTPEEGVKLGEPPLPNDPQSIEVEIVTPAREGPFRYEVRIWTDMHDEPIRMVIDGVVSTE